MGKSYSFRLSKEDVRTSYVSDFVTTYLQREYPGRFQQRDVDAIVSKIESEKQFWNMMNTLLSSYALTHMESQNEECPKGYQNA